MLFCTSSPNLVILAWTGDELWCGQPQNGVNFDFKINLTPKTIGTLTKVFCIFGPYLVILALASPKLSRKQASDWYTHTHTYRQMQATTLPEGQNWPWVKIIQDASSHPTFIQQENWPEALHRPTKFCNLCVPSDKSTDSLSSIYITLMPLVI